MATAILRSQDCLRDRCFRHEILTLCPPVKPRRNPNSIPTANPNSNPNRNPNAASRSRRRRRSPMGFPTNQQAKAQNRLRDEPLVVKGPAKNLVMGEVKILKRGEPLVSAKKDDCERLGVKSKGDSDLVLGSTDRLGPEPDMVQKEIRVADLKVVDGMYAGSGTYTSPPPSSVPVPVFIGRNGMATSDLRRMLKISMV